MKFHSSGFLPALCLTVALTHPCAAAETNQPAARPAVTPTAAAPAVTSRVLTERAPGNLVLSRLFAVMTPEQRSGYTQGMAARSQEARTLEQRLQAARDALYQSGIGEKIDEGAIRKKAADLAELEAQLTILRAQVLANISPALTQDQITKARTSVFPVPPPRRTMEDMIRDEQGRPLKKPAEKSN